MGPICHIYPYKSLTEIKHGRQPNRRGDHMKMEVTSLGMPEPLPEEAGSGKEQILP